MQELFARLVTALSVSGPGSADVQRVLDEIKARFPDQVPLADGMVKAWNVSQGGQPQPVQPNGISPTSWKFFVPVLAALGIGGGAGAGIDGNSMGRFWDLVKGVPLPKVYDRWELLGIVAGVGAAVGLGHAFYRNNWTFVLPSFSRSANQFRVASLGSLRNAGVAAAVAVVTTWLAFNGTSGPKAGTNLLNWTVISSAAAAGLVGSRMASGEVEKSVLWEALAKSSATPASVDVSRAVNAAKTPLDAAAIATGQAVPGIKPPKEFNLVRQTPDIEADLLELFDKPTLKAMLTGLGKPLGADGAGLTLEPLADVQLLKPALRGVLKDIKIPVVAVMTPEAFLTDIDGRGIDVSNLKDVLGNVHGKAVRVKELLGSLPPAWTLPADRV